MIRREAKLNADGFLSSRQLSVLLGVPEDELRDEVRRSRAHLAEGDGSLQPMRLPKEWLRRGRERTALANSDDMGIAMQVLPVIDEPTAAWRDRNGRVWHVSKEIAPGVLMMACDPGPFFGALTPMTVQALAASHGPLERVDGESR